MSNSELYISTEDFYLECPHCGDTIEVLNITGRFINPNQCNGCMGFYNLSVTVEPD